MIIYKATNKINNKCYIGQTRHDLEFRKKQHISNAKKNVKTHFYNALRKYGADSFDWEVIFVTNDKDTLNIMETYYITKYDSIKNGYNMVDGGNNNVMDIESVKLKHAKAMQSSTVRNKISESMKKLRKEYGFSQETRKKISDALKGNHNFGNCDTRSIPCYCVLESGEELHFHSYKDAHKWWMSVDNPFRANSEAISQRKIKQSIKYGFFTYLKNKFEYPKWFKEEVVK